MLLLSRKTKRVSHCRRCQTLIPPNTFIRSQKLDRVFCCSKCTGFFASRYSFLIKVKEPLTEEELKWKEDYDTAWYGFVYNYTGIPC